MKQGKQRMRKSVFALALAVVMIAGLCGISAAAAPVITEKDGTVTLSENGLSVVVSGVVSRESVRLNAFDDPVTVYHLAPGASVVMRNDSNEDDCIYSWYDGWSAEKGRVWSFSGAGYDRDVECPAGHSLTYTPTPVFSGEDGRLKVNKDLPETAAFVFEDIMWGGISVFFAQDNGRVSLANCTVDGVPFDSYFAGKGFETATAYASTQTVTIDGKAVELQAYALKDANGNATNYVKLRDVAYVLNGTAARFDVGWDGNVNIITGQSYTATGSEMFTPLLRRPALCRSHCRDQGERHRGGAGGNLPHGRQRRRLHLLPAPRFGQDPRLQCRLERRQRHFHPDRQALYRRRLKLPCARVRTGPFVPGSGPDADWQICRFEPVKIPAADAAGIFAFLSGGRRRRRGWAELSVPEGLKFCSAFRKTAAFAPPSCINSLLGLSFCYHM